MGDSYSMSISGESPSAETLNRDPWHSREATVWIFLWEKYSTIFIFIYWTTTVEYFGKRETKTISVCMLFLTDIQTKTKTELEKIQILTLYTFAPSWITAQVVVSSGLLFQYQVARQSPVKSPTQKSIHTEIEINWQTDTEIIFYLT